MIANSDSSPITVTIRNLNVVRSAGGQLVAIENRRAMAIASIIPADNVTRWEGKDWWLGIFLSYRNIAVEKVALEIFTWSPIPLGIGT